MKKRDFEDKVDLEEGLSSIHMTLWNLGERGTKLSLEEDIQNIAIMYREEHSTYGHQVFDSLWFCLFNLPYKASLYIAVLSLIAQEYDLTDHFGDILQKEINIAAVDPNSWKLGHVLRIWAQVAGSTLIISPEGLLQTFTLLLSFCETLNPNVSYWLLKSILSSFPFAAKKLKEEPEWDEFVRKLLYCCSNIDVEFSRIYATEKLIGLGLVLEDLKNKDYEFELNILSSSMDLSEGISESKVIKISEFKIDQEAVSNFAIFKGDFRIHIDAFETSSLFDMWLLNEWFSQIVIFFHDNHRKGLEFLFGAVPEGFGDSAKVIQNFLFGELLRTNKSDKYYQVYIEILLVDACRFSKSFPPALARGMFFLVSKLDEESYSYRAVLRLASWFAFHLAHFDFKWPWDEWKNAQEWPMTSLKRIFLLETFEQLLRLSYYERIVNITPEFLKSFLPHTLKPNFEIGESGSGKHQLMDALKAKKTLEEIEMILAGQTQPALLLLNCILFVGSKTLSHAQSIFDRNLMLLKKYLTDRFETLEVVREFWKFNCQNHEIAVKRLLTLNLVSEVDIQNWIRRCLKKKLENLESFEEIERQVLRTPIVDLCDPIDIEAILGELIVDNEIAERLSQFFKN